MKRTRIILSVIAAMALAGCGGSTGSGTNNAPNAPATPSTSCLDVPAQFFQDIDAHGQVVKSGAVKSTEQTANGHDIYEVAAKFDDGTVAVWSTGMSIVGGGPTFPMNDAAREHSDQGVDAPASALPNDPDGMQRAMDCVT